MSPEARTTMLKTITEEQWQGFVASYAQLKGWRSYHTYDARRSSAGFPDLTLVRGDRIVFAELKKQDGKVTDAQQRWLDELGRAAAASNGALAVYCWRPGDEAEVREVLA